MSQGLGAASLSTCKMSHMTIRLTQINQIARQWAPRLDTSEADVRSYLTQNIYYRLDAGCLEGLRLFYQYAAEIGALPAAPELQFVDAMKEVVL